MAKAYSAFILSWHYEDYGVHEDVTVGVFRSLAAAETVRDAMQAAAKLVADRFDRLDRWQCERHRRLPEQTLIYVDADEFWKKRRAEICADLSQKLAFEGTPAIAGFRMYRGADVFLGQHTARPQRTAKRPRA